MINVKDEIHTYREESLESIDKDIRKLTNAIFQECCKGNPDKNKTIVGLYNKQPPISNKNSRV